MFKMRFLYSKLEILKNHILSFYPKVMTQILLELIDFDKEDFLLPLTKIDLNSIKQSY